MTIREAITSATARLEEAGVPDPHIDAEWMLEHVTGLDRLALRIHHAKELTQEQEQKGLKSRKATEPRL